MAEPIPSISLDELRRLCQEYDGIEGHYPEHQWEGWSIWQFFALRLAGTVPDWWADPPADWHISEEA